MQYVCVSIHVQQGRRLPSGKFWLLLHVFLAYCILFLPWVFPCLFLFIIVASKERERPSSAFCCIINNFFLKHIQLTHSCTHSKGLSNGQKWCKFYMGMPATAVSIEWIIYGVMNTVTLAKFCNLLCNIGFLKSRNCCHHLYIFVRFIS